MQAFHRREAPAQALRGARKTHSAVSPDGRLKYTAAMPAAPPSLLRIGPFSRLARVTIKTLRFYDAAGLFRPVWTDPRSGYRFYSTAQLPALRRIRVLRELGCSLAEIQQLTGSSPDGVLSGAHAGLLRRRLMIGVATAELRLRQLDVLLGHQKDGRDSCAPTPLGTASLPLLERPIAAAPAFTIRDSVRAGSTDIQRMFESAEREVARLGIRSQTSPFLLLYDMYPQTRVYPQTGVYPQDSHGSHADTEVCIPVRPEALGSPGVRLVEPVTRAACVQFSGDYTQAPLLFDAALDSMSGTSLRLAGPIREVYLRFGADQQGYRIDPRFLTDQVSQYRTELQIPLFSCAARNSSAGC